MSWNVLYSLREGIVGLRRARLATAVTVSTVAVTLTLLGIFLVLTVNVRKVVELFKERMALEVFIDNSLSSEEIGDLERRILSVQGVERATFISREEALSRFREEFGKDPLTLLGENPLPPSFQIRLRREERSHAGTKGVARQIEGLDGVDEVVYHGKLFRVVDRISRIVLMADGILFLVVLMSAVLLVSNTLRLTILSQYRTIQIMELVGATESFIRRPYVIQGVLQGGLGGGIGSMVVWGLVLAVRFRFPHLLEVPPILILVPFFLGLLLGFLGSRVGLRRFMGV